MCYAKEQFLSRLLDEELSRFVFIIIFSVATAEKEIYIMLEKITLTVDELAARLGIGRNSAYALAKSEGFPALRIGSRIIIPSKALESWLAEKVGQKTILLDQNAS